MSLMHLWHVLAVPVSFLAYFVAHASAHFSSGFTGNSILNPANSPLRSRAPTFSVSLSPLPRSFVHSKLGERVESTLLALLPPLPHLTFTLSQQSILGFRFPCHVLKLHTGHF
eukprot:6190404-Pleurochrysis_carterae.AAC.3